MTTYDDNDMKVAGRLTRIETILENLLDSLKEMKAAWDQRVEQRDKEKLEVETRLKSLETTRSFQYGISVTIGVVVTFLVQFILKVFIK